MNFGLVPLKPKSPLIRFWAAKREDGSSDVWVDIDKQNKSDRRRVLSVINKTAAEGRYESPEIYRRIEPNIFEIKTKGGYRVFAYDPGGSEILLVVGRRKPKQNEFEACVERTRSMAREWEQFMEEKGWRT